MATEIRCNLIVDSCCDLPVELIDVDGIELLKFPYVGRDGEHLDDLFQTISAHEFYEGMAKGDMPSTSQVPIASYRECFERAIASGVPTVYLSFTSGLSGTFDTAVMVRDQLVAEHPEAELYVVDTLLASVAEGLFVYEAIRQRRHGLTAKELVAWAEEARFYIHELFMVDDLTALARGGRIPPSVAFAGAKLNVKPLLDIDLEGKLSLVGVARGRKKGIHQLAEFYNTRARDARERADHRVMIGNSDCPKDVERLKDEIVHENESAMFIESSIGPVIGSHVGPGMLAVVYWGDDCREELTVSDRIARKVRQK